jgi:tetratricopeptide (TPR) repeat protein
VSGERRPISLAEAAADVAALRAGTPTPRSLIHVAHVAEHALRRTLRDDPTAPVELRLRALAPEELPLDDLLAELRRHDRIPVELAAGVHELAAAAARAETGAPVEPRDTANALTVADALDSLLRRRPAAATMEDPLFAADTDAALSSDEVDVVVRHVPAEAPSGGFRWLGVLLGVAAVVALAAWVASRGGGGLERADALAERGRTAAAAAVLRETGSDPGAAARLARVYREAGRPTEALRAVREGLAASPRDPRLHEELGLLLLEQQRPAEAVRAYRTALVADSASERAWVGLVRALRAGGDAPAAERVLARAPEAARILAGPAPAPPAPVDVPPAP